MGPVPVGAERGVASGADSGTLARGDDGRVPAGRFVFSQRWRSSEVNSTVY